MKNLSFARNRLNALLLAQGFGFVGALVPRLTDLFVSGNVVGIFGGVLEGAGVDAVTRSSTRPSAALASTVTAGLAFGP